MRAIQGVVTEEIAAAVDATAIASEPAYRVASYRKLVEQVARLAYLNLDCLLFYRGQHRDFRNKVGASTFYPTMYRGAYVRREEVRSLFERLAQAAGAGAVPAPQQGTSGGNDSAMQPLWNAGRVAFPAEWALRAAVADPLVAHQIADATVGM